MGPIIGRRRCGRAAGMGPAKCPWPRERIAMAAEARRGGPSGVIGRRHGGTLPIVVDVSGRRHGRSEGCCDKSRGVLPIEPAKSAVDVSRPIADRDKAQPLLVDRAGWGRGAGGEENVEEEPLAMRWQAHPRRPARRSDWITEGQE